MGEGEEIPYSKASVTEIPYAELGIAKWAKAVSIEAIRDKGYEAAVQMTDNEFLFELQNEVTGRFYQYLNTGTLTLKESTWQRALAMAKGSVLNKFKQMRRTASEIVGFVNVLDLYDYLGDRDISVQSEFGFTYLKNFLGFGTVFLLSDEEIERGRVIATPAENIVLYYVDPSDSDYARAGLSYTTDGETNLIGVHMQGNYATAVSEVYAIMGVTLFAEYQDAIAVATVTAGQGPVSLPNGAAGVGTIATEAARLITGGQSPLSLPNGAANMSSVATEAGGGQDLVSAPNGADDSASAATVRKTRARSRVAAGQSPVSAPNGSARNGGAATVAETASESAAVQA